jgi:hypothetical protein
VKFDGHFQCPLSDVRRPLSQHPLYELRKTKGTGKKVLPVPLFDIKFRRALRPGTRKRKQRPFSSCSGERPYHPDLTAAKKCPDRTKERRNGYPDAVDGALSAMECSVISR